MKQNVYLDSKPRYEILDGLRGVAALMVILFHCFETYKPTIGRQIINHGYLAVDFFFILSGFVIGYAYDDRWDKMSTWSFFKRRLVRLHPMVIMGTIVGACLFFFQDAAFPMILETPLWKFLICILMGLLMIPAGPKMDIRGWMETNSFNGPNWSLSYEYIGNILYAFFLRKLPRFALGILCVLAAFLTLNLTLGWDIFNLFDGTKYDVIGGWSLTADQITIGFTRLLYPFLCGLLISRILPSHRSESNPSGSPVRLKNGFWICAIAIITILGIPQIMGKDCVADGLYQAVSIIILFPLIILAGAGSEMNGSRSASICKFFGNISYPLYITHYPVMYMQMAWVAAHPDAPLWMNIALNAAVVTLSVGMAWAIFKLYDLPVRNWLTEKWLKKQKSQVSH